MTRISVPLLVAALAIFVLLFGVAFRVNGQEQDPTVEVQITQQLHAALDALEAGGGAYGSTNASATVEIVAVLREQVDVAELSTSLTNASSANAFPADVHVRGRSRYAALVEKAQRTQAPLRAWLDARGTSYRAYYIVNMLLIQGDAALVAQLRQRPEIERLALNVTTEALDLAAPPSAVAALPPAWRVGRGGPQSVALPWGLAFIHAPEAWALGYTGEGIVVASQDTGVQWDHPALQSAYRGWDSATMTVTHTYNWFDAWGVDAARSTQCSGDAATDAQIPCDDNGHGTHTVGTMVGNAPGSPPGDGGTVLGVAPDAEWIGCRNMTAGVGSPTSYAACFEFFLAP